MKKVIVIFSLMNLIFLTGCLGLGGEEVYSPMPDYSPAPFDELNGNLFAVLSKRRLAGPGAYTILYNLETLQVEKNIPIANAMSEIDFEVYYWEGKYYYQQSGYREGKLSNSWIGVIDSKTGEIKEIPIKFPGTISGITQDGKMYVLSHFLTSEGICITVIDTNLDKVLDEIYWDSKGPLAYLSADFMYNGNGYSYFGSDLWSTESRLMKINTQTNQVENLYQFQEGLAAVYGVPAPNNQYLYVSMGPIFRENREGESLYNTNQILAIPIAETNQVKWIDLPSPEWIFGSIGKNFTAWDWNPTWLAIYEDWIYIQILCQKDALLSTHIKYNIETGEFVKLDFDIPAAVKMDVIGDKLVYLLTWGGQSGVHISVVDLLTDQVLINKQNIIRHD